MERLRDRTFGYTLAGVTGAMAAFIAWRGGNAVPLATVSAMLLVTATVFPIGLLPLNRILHALVKRLFVVTNYVVLGVAFVVLFIPTAMILRLAKVDPMNRRIDRDAASYWSTVFRQSDPGTFNDMF